MMQKLQFANQAKSDFLAKMSHEMRTPLNAIIGLSALALEDETVNEETRLNIEKVGNAGDILLSTVNDILDLSKIEAGKLELAPVKYDMPSLLNDTVTQSVMHIGEKPIEFILDIDETLPALLCGDDRRIKQLFNNLLSNAFKYTKEGTVELGVRCERDGEDAETVWMTAWVKDTGVGIKPEKIASLFDEFMQADTQINRHVVGTGLGLSITKKMAELMGGGITVESDYGKGSTFTVTLRQGFVTDAHIGSDVVDNLKRFKYSEHKRRRDAMYARTKLPYARVLVVDDNVTNLDVARG
jgi:signal transduction histidine kinase